MPFDIKIAQTKEGPKFVTVLPPGERRPTDITFYVNPRTRKVPNYTYLEEGDTAIYDQISCKMDQL